MKKLIVLGGSVWLVAGLLTSSTFAGPSAFKADMTCDGITDQGNVTLAPKGKLSIVIKAPNLSSDPYDCQLRCSGLDARFVNDCGVKTPNKNLLKINTELPASIDCTEPSLVLLIDGVEKCWSFYKFSDNDQSLTDSDE